MTKIFEKKEINFDFKNIEEDENFMYLKGMVTPYDGKADLSGDKIEKGAYERTLYQKGLERPLFWHHDSKQPIGSARFKDTDEGLILTEGKIAKKVARGNDTAILVGMKAIKGLSIGYNTIKASFKDGFKHLKEIALHELSVVPFPMNEGSFITDAKTEIFESSFSEALEYVLKNIKDAKKTDVELVSKAISDFNILLTKNFNVTDPLRSEQKNDKLELNFERELIVNNFKNFLRENLK